MRYTNPGLLCFSSKMVQDRDIVAMADRQEVGYDIATNGAIFNKLNDLWPRLKGTLLFNILYPVNDYYIATVSSLLWNVNRNVMRHVEFE